MGNPQPSDTDRPVTGVPRSEVSGDSFFTEEGRSGVRVIDRDRLDELRELEADSAPGLVATLFHSFLTAVQADLDSLARAVERGDATVLCDVCHRLKGTTLTLGAGAASEACAALESAASAGRVGLYPALLAQLKLECARVAADVDGWAEQ